MAKTVLPTDFQDDVLDESMGDKRRYRKESYSDGSFSLTDETVYTSSGSDLGAALINLICQCINESADVNMIIKDLDTLKALAQDGYLLDALLAKTIYPIPVYATEEPETVEEGTIVYVYEE